MLYLVIGGFWRMRGYRTAPTVADMEFTRELEKSDWKSFLDDLSQELPTSDIRIEIISPELGDEVEGAGLLLAHRAGTDAHRLTARPYEPARKRQTLTEP